MTPSLGFLPYGDVGLPLLCLSDTPEPFFGSKGASLTFEGLPFTLLQVERLCTCSPLLPLPHLIPLLLSLLLPLLTRLAFSPWREPLAGQP